jgi:lipopolysaccharide/colanic/teichoic acid biosynthesis glycosyltransferase
MKGFPKRVFDFTLSGLALFFAGPVLGLVAILIKLDSAGPVFFKQERMGQGFRPFFIYKLRTMIHQADTQGPFITAGKDSRVTRVGAFLRRTKIDELPQLINVLKGEMSLVGPRPEVPKYTEMFRQDYEEILCIRPGITDLASLKYRHEAELLGQSANPEEQYLTQILPDKIRLAKEYLRTSSFSVDMRVITKTILKMVQ